MSAIKYWFKNTKKNKKKKNMFSVEIVALCSGDCNSIEHKLKETDWYSQSCEQVTHLDHQTGGCLLIEMVGILGTFSDMFGL